ncbi:MAG: glycosyltransferase family 4 protein, partial [Bacteroidetes bacterium]|nr:glycosyltransferase family 4 protein [Bacteroidota bacterium]
MKVLLVHNEYLQRGGEDTVFGIEKDLLESHGNEVDTLTFNNADIASFWDKARFMFKSIYNSDAYKKMEAKIKAFQPDVIHVHNFFYVASPSIFYAAKHHNVPIVQTLHNYRLICPSAYLYHNGEIYEDNVNKVFPIGAIFKKVWNNSLLQTASIASITAFHKMRNTFRDKVDGFIVFTEFAKSIFVNSSLQVPENQFFIKPNFTDDFGYNGGERGDYYLFIGRLSEEKGIEVLLDACEHYDFKLKILGDGPLRGLVESRAATNSNIDYLGPKPKTEVIQYLKSA